MNRKQRPVSLIESRRVRRILICGLIAVFAGAASPLLAAEAVREDGPATPADEFESIRKLADEGKHQHAVRAIADFIRRNARWERIEEANRLYGVELVESGDVSMGCEILDRLIKEAPEAEKNAPVYFYRAQGLEALGDFPGAVLAYDVVVRRFPKHVLAPQAALNEALLSEKILKNPRRAREIYELFATNYPNHEETPSVLNHLALMAEQANDIPGAVMRYQQYAQRYPGDIGNPMMNGTVAGAAAAMWRAAALTEHTIKKPRDACLLYQDYAKLPLASKAGGLRQATLMALANPEAGDANALFKQAHEANPADEELRLRYAHWLAGPGKNPEEAAKHLAQIAASSKNWAYVVDCLNRLGPERVRAFLDQHPTNLPVFEHYLNWFKEGDKRAEGRKTLDLWLARTDIDWKTAIAKQWFAWTGELEDCGRLIKAADSEGRMDESLAATLTAADRFLGQNEPDKAQAALVNALNTWSIYPDFRKADFSTRLAQIALRQPLMVPKPPPPPQPEPPAGQPNPPEGQPQPAPAPQTDEKMISPQGKAARTTAIDLIKQHKLDDDPIGADLAARIAHELDPAAAVPAMQKAADLLMGADRLDLATKHVGWLLEILPEHSELLVDLLDQVVQKGSKGWETLWKETILPKAQAELNHFSAVNPPTEQSRLARERLARFFDPKQSVAAHQDFLNNHGGSAYAAAVRRSLWQEMKRAGIDPKPHVMQAIKDLAANPALIRSIPVDQVPAGPEGYELYVANARKINPGADRSLGADILLYLARLHQAFRRHAEAMQTLRELVGKYGDTPQAVEGKRLAAELFKHAYSAPGVTQADPEQAFAWTMELCLNGRENTFANLSDTAWRVACHPAYRLHSVEDFDALYMYSTHGHVGWPKDLGEFLTGMYASHPGDGHGPVSTVQSGPAPYGGGDKFMLYRWALLRAPADGVYNFWFSGDDYVGIDIDGRCFNIPNQNHNHAGVWLSRGLHMIQIVYGDWGGGASSVVDWQPPGGQRLRLGPEAFSPERYPLILSEAAVNQGAFGVAQWDAYVRKYPRDLRGRMMRLETLILADPSRAMGELQQLMKQFPGNLRHRERYADCLWRIGRRDHALKEYEALAAQQEHGLWESSYNSVCRAIFLAGDTPISFEDEFEDRIRDCGDWTTWLSRAKHDGDEAALHAHTWAESQLTDWVERARLRQEAMGRINGAVARERAQVQAAQALAAKPDAKPEVKAKAEAAVVRSQLRLKELEQELRLAQANAESARARLAAFRTAVGLGPDQPTMDLPVNFAASCLKNGTIPPGSARVVAERLWATEDKDRARPFLEYIVKYSSDAGLVTWSGDRLVDLAMAGKEIGSAAEIMASVGMRNPRDGQHAQRLAKACDLAMESGNVFTFARSAQVLARLHPGNKHFSGYLPKLGEVFEKAGNYTSAEYEFSRVIKSAKEPSRKRYAQLALAGLYEKLGRSKDALKVLSSLVRLELPDEKRPPRRTTAELEEEDTVALLLAARCYLSLEKGDLALDAYDRAEIQKDFGQAVKPDRELLEDLARACLLGSGPDVTRKKEREPGSALPAVILQRGQKVLKLVDTLFRFYDKQMDPYQTASATLLRADASIMMRNYPRAIEEIRAAKKAAGDSAGTYLADLKMGEVHLATDNEDQAVPIFKKLSRMNLPDVSPVALFWLGTTHLKMNRRDDAIEAFRILWERFSDSELVRQAIYTIARTYAEQGAFLDAIRLYEAVGAINSMTCEKVVPGDMLTAKVWDADHYLGTGEYTIPVQVRSSSGDSEHLLLDMNKINHSLFLGTIRVELGEPNQGDGVLQVYGTDMIYVSYQDKFKGLQEDEKATAESVAGERSTSLIQVVDDAEIRVSPTVFVEREEEEDDIYVEKTEEELEEERRLAALSAKLERGEAVVRPANLIYIRVKDGDLDRSMECDKIKLTVFTYSPEELGRTRRRQYDLARQMEKPLGLPISDALPDNGEFTWQRHPSPPPAGRPRLDHVQVELTETGPHTGIFYGQLKTNVNTATAIASDTAGDNMAAYAIDGKNGAKDAWMGFIDNRPGKWLEIDLKELYDVGKIIWDRGEGAGDRYLIDYTVTLRGEDAPVLIERKGNKSAHNNEIVPERPVRCRWIRFTAFTFEGDAPAISQVQIFDADGKQLVPGETSPIERAMNDVLEFNVGDCMAAEMLDEENFEPARAIKRTSNPLGVAYVDGHIDAVYISRGKNKYLGSLLYDAKDDKEDVYARRTKRVLPDDVLQIAIIDPDLDVDSTLNTVTCEVWSSSGDSAELEAEEIDQTAAVFTARIQLSPNPEAMQDGRLYVRPRGFVMMRYLDEQNRDPGHSVNRQSFIFVADDEVADFIGSTIAVESPEGSEESFSNIPHRVFELREPDQALPKIDRLEMQAMSFATGDSCTFAVLLRNLDGVFSSRLPIAVGDKPVIKRPKDADPRAPRRVRTLDDWYWWQHRRTNPDGRTREEEDVFNIPLAVYGDDMVWMSYKDATPQVRAARLFVPIAGPEILGDLMKLDVRTDLLPEQAVTEGIAVLLKDPYLALADRRKEREARMMDEIARKKRSYRKLLAAYEAALERISKRIEELTPRQAEEEPPQEPEEKPPEEIKEGDAPLVQEEAAGIGELGIDDFLATENLILAASLRRDRDGLAQAMKALQLRLKALARYPTDVLEAQIARTEEEYRAGAQAVGEAVGREEEVGIATEAPWYRKADWWKNCGGLIPGTLLKVRVEDPDLAGGDDQRIDSLEVLVASIGSELPKIIKLRAKAVPDAEGVFELSIPTARDENEQGALSLKGARSLMLMYTDQAQQKFTPKRSSYLSFASNADLNVTGPDFLESKSSFHLGEEVYLIIRDMDMDNTRERDYVWVEFTSDLGDTELLPVRESQPHTGVFRGSIRTEFSEPKEKDGVLSARFGGTFGVTYVDQLWRDDPEKGEKSVLPPVLSAEGSFVPGTDGTVEVFARQLKRGSLQRDVLFSTALAEYELGKSSTEMGAVQRGRQHLVESRDKYRTLIEQYPDDPVCAHATYYLGNIHFLLGDFPAAVKSLQEVIDRWPKSEFKAKALYKLGTCHMKADEMKRAIECFVNLAYHHKDSPLVADAMLALAQNFSSEKRYKAAAGIGYAFVKKFPDHEKAGNVYLRLAGWLIVEKDYRRAVAVLEEAEKNLPDSPNMPAFLYWHADCIFKVSGVGSVDYKRGIILLQRVTYDYPDSKWAKYAAARLAEKDVMQ